MEALLLWAVAGGLLALGFTVTHWAVAVLGVLVLLYWYEKFLAAVKLLRTAPLASGVVKELTTHPTWRDLSVADALLPDGKVIKVSMPTALVAGLLEKHGQCEVLFLKGSGRRESDPEWGAVLAAREVRG